MAASSYPNSLSVWIAVCFIVVISVTCQSGWAHVATPDTIQNGDFEEVDESGNLIGWLIPKVLQTQGYRLVVETENVRSRQRAACLDATKAERGPGSFGNLMQSIDATPFQGKRVRFQAAVRTDELQENGRAQLWFRVDREPLNGEARIGAFDNMQDRPIRSDTWKQYQIVLKVDDDAQRIAIGLLFLGKGKAWIDDATLEIVDDQTSTTGSSMSASSSDEPQPFFNHWLWLPFIAISLFVLAQRDVFARQPIEPSPSEERDAHHDLVYDGSHFQTSAVQRFALRFSVAYWLLYSLPSPIPSLLPVVGWKMASAYSAVADKLIRWTALNVLGIERSLVPPGGSGDTTFDYVRLFGCFVIAMAIAVIWSIVDRRRARYALVNDLLRSYLRYVLAFTMLGYGMAKVGSAMNQFPAPGVEQLIKTYGDSSPMNLLWTFMGASRAYTFFAGMGEIVAALLLIWRRTTTLGALVVVGVMTNVVMMNFCYDVPVKQYSSHLLMMAIYLLIPDMPRLTNLLLWNRPTGSVCWQPVYASGRLIWAHRLLKAYVLLIGITFPLVGKIVEELNPATPLAAPKFFGSYEVVEFVRDGQIVPPLSTDGTRWRLVSLRRLPYRPGGGFGQTDYAAIRMMTHSPAGGVMTLSDDEQVIKLQSGTESLPSELKVRIVDENNIELSSDGEDQIITAKLKRIRLEDFLLVNRGFRWINEIPFNR